MKLTKLFTPMRLAMLGLLGLIAACAEQPGTGSAAKAPVAATAALTVEAPALSAGTYNVVMSDQYQSDNMTALIVLDEAGAATVLSSSAAENVQVQFDDDGNATITWERPQGCGPRTYRVTLEPDGTATGERDRSRCRSGSRDFSGAYTRSAT